MRDARWTCPAWTTLGMAAALLVPLPVRAQDGAPLSASLVLAVDDRALARCVETADLAARVEDILGRDVIREPPVRLAVHVTLRRDELGTVAVVRLTEGDVVHDEREVVHGGRCRSLPGPLSLVIAMLLDDRGRAEQLDLTAASAPVQSPLPLPTEPDLAAVATVVAPAADLAPAPEPGGWSAVISLGAAMSIGFLPGPAFGPELRGRVGPRGGFSALVTMTVFPWATSGGMPGGEFSGFVGALGACTPRYNDAPPLAIGGCAAVGGGVIHGSGTSIMRSYERFEPWLDVEAVLELGLRLGGPVGVSLRVGALVPILRPTFYVRLGEQVLTVHSAWPVVPVVGLTLDLGDP